MSGDRHLRPDPDGRLRGSPSKLANVLVTATADSARSIAGQHLLQLLVNLLARQFGAVRSVLLDVNDCPVQPGVFLSPRVDEGTLVAALIALGDAVGDGEITVRVADATTATSVVCVGCGIDPRTFGVPGIAITGRGWRAYARSDGAIGLLDGDSANPLGPQLAACVAAGFCFKAAYYKHGKVDAALDLWTGGDDGPEPTGIELPSAYVLGLGAVGAAFGYAIAAARGLTGHLVAVDPQEMSDTDRNRLLSGTWASVGTAKYILFKSMFAGGGVGVSGFKGRWPQDYLGESARDVPADLRADEQQGRFRWVISCVDRNRDRAAIAAQLPRHIFAGSTFGMAAQTAYYSMVGPCECLACRHRSLRQLNVEELAQGLKAMTGEQRSAWYRDYGASQPVRAAIDEYLVDSTCAGPGAADLAKLGLAGEVDWAVGFVSAAAGVILAARFIRAAILGVDVEIARGSECRLLFWADELRVSRAERACDCPLCRHPSWAWAQLWPEGKRTDSSPRT